MNDLIIIGASGFSREIGWVVERINNANPTWNFLGYLDDDPKKAGQILNGVPVLGTTDDAKKYPNAYFACAIGASKLRKSVVTRVKAANPQMKFATLVDPDVAISPYVAIGEGTIICPGNSITVNITLGEHVVINMNCTIGHDAVLEDFASLYPSVNISGNVHIKTCTEIGTGTQVLQGLTIAENTIVGASAAVIRDITEPGTYVGVPARKIK